MDIMMGKANGLEAARYLRERTQKECLIFISSYSIFALESFSVKPFGYLTKPLYYQTFRNELNSAFRYLGTRASSFIMLKDKNSAEKKPVSINSIIYVEVVDHDVFFYLEGEVIAVKTTISNVAEELKDYGFLQPHQAYLLNYRQIRTIGKSIMMSNGHSVPLSKPRRKQFMAQFAALIGKSL